MERILVGLKRVVDYNVRVRVKSDGSGVETDGVKMSINPFDEIALEEALRIKERGDANEVVVASIGGSECQQQLRTGLAMGADRAILVETDDAVDPLTSAKIFLELVNRESPELVILGKQAIDDDNNQTGQMLAALMGRPLGSYISRIEKNDGGFAITREIDAGLEDLQITSPAVVTADLRLNEPRYASLPNIMKAKKKPIDAMSPADIGVEVVNRLQVVRVDEPPAREAGVMVTGASELVDKLKNEAKVI